MRQVAGNALSRFLFKVLAGADAQINGRIAIDVRSVAGTEAMPLDKAIAEELEQVDIILRWATEQEQSVARRWYRVCYELRRATPCRYSVECHSPRAVGVPASKAPHPPPSASKPVHDAC